MAMWPFAHLAPPPALESPQASRPTSVQMDALPLDPPPSVPRSAGLLMNLPSSSFSLEESRESDAPPLPLSSSPTRPIPRPPIPASAPPEQPAAPKREPSQRRMSIRRELPPLPSQEFSVTSSALLSPPRTRPDASALADQHNGLLSPPRSRKETDFVVGGARVSDSGPPLPSAPRAGSRRGFTPAVPTQWSMVPAPVVPARKPSDRTSVARALPPQPVPPQSVFATPVVATSNMIPNLPLDVPRAPEKVPQAYTPPTESKAANWVYSAEEQALMKAVAQTAEARGKKDVGLAPLFEARMILARRFKACVDDVVEKRDYLIKRLTLLMDDIEKERNYRDEQLEQLLMIENLAQSILTLKEDVAGLSRETDELKEKIDLQEKRATQRMNKNGLRVSVLLGRVVIEAGTAEKLVENLFTTMEGGVVPEYASTFLATYRSFTSSEAVLKQVIAKYKEMQAGGDSTRKLRLRVCNFLKLWVSSYWEPSDEHLEVEYKTFAERVVALETNSRPLTEMLLKALDRHEQQVFTEAPPAPVTPKMLAFEILDISPLELARQLTIQDHELFSAIRLSEFLKQNWTRKDSDVKAPHIKRMIAQFNRSGNWVASVVLTERHRNKRAQIVEQFIKVAGKCRELNNFNSLAWILSALEHEPVLRLRKTWEKVRAKHKNEMAALRLLMSPERSFKLYRTALSSCQPPVMPYLVIYLRDLTLIEESAPDFIEGGLINFAKRSKVGDIIEEIRMYQQRGYNLQRVDEIGKLTNSTLLPESQQNVISRELEPDPSYVGRGRTGVTLGDPR